MDKYKTVLDITNYSDFGVMPVVESVSSAIPPFWSILLFIIWVFLTGASYYSILKTTGRKRFWHCLTASSFIMFLSSLVITSINTASITYLNGYWVGFYILMVLGSWIMLSNYK